MKILLSPAKSLNLESKLPTKKYTQPLFLKEAQQINAQLASKSKTQIKNVLNISDALATLNEARYKNFSTPFTAQNARPAIFTFSGDVYVGFDAFTLSASKIEPLQDTVRILSGLYGLLKPLDLIQPYRLEMGTPLKLEGKKNLYDFWGNKITQALNAEIKENELILNLASNEYFKAINTKKLKGHLITPVFKDFKNGKLKVISFFAKNARGTMARFVLDHKVKSYKDLLTFNGNGYTFSELETTQIEKPVFIRN